MKIIIRTFVIALAVTGAIATTATTNASAKTTVTASKSSAMPVPRCPYNDPTGCGIGTW